MQGDFPAGVSLTPEESWELTRAISPRDRVRTAVLESHGLRHQGVQIRRKGICRHGLHTAHRQDPS